jgi:NhaP-type Na+/H+ or K+/H+ antiporter
MLGVISLSMGVLLGFLTSYMFKYMRFLTHNAVCEMFIIIVMSLISYFASDMIIIAGI